MKSPIAVLMPMTHHITTDLARLCASEPVQSSTVPPSLPCAVLAEDYAGEQHPPITGGFSTWHPSVPPCLCGESSVSVPELRSLIARIAAFQTSRFPNQTLQGKLAHLVKEAMELSTCAGDDPHEWADVLNLLLGAALLKGWTFADLVRHAHDKMAICEARQWPSEPGPDGCYHHIKEPTPESEPSWQPVAIEVQNDRGISGPDVAWVKLRDGRVIEIGDDGLNVFRSVAVFEKGFEPEHSVTFLP